MEAFDNAKVDPQRLKKLNERIGPPEVSFFVLFLGRFTLAGIISS